MNKKWIFLIRESTKQTFLLLRKIAPFYSPLFKSEIIASKKFFDHIAHSQKRKKDISEQLERQLIIPFVPIIIESGICTDIRKEADITFFRLEKKIKNHHFALIIERKNAVFRLLSCFRVHAKKELVSVSIDPSLIEENTS